MTLKDLEMGINYNMGVHGKGKRNSNGDALLQFLVQHGLFACNTAFEHPSRHKTTWTGWIKNPSNPTTSFPVYNQIDYILCKCTSTCLLTDARSYGGATLSSDHKLVVAKLQFSFIPKIWKQLPQKNLTPNLTSNSFVMMLLYKKSIMKISLSVLKNCHQH